MKKYLIVIVVFISYGQCFGKEKKVWVFRLPLGRLYNQSNTEFMNTSGLGLYFESKFLYQDRFIFGYRFEPIALIYGVLVLPGGCTEEHPRYPGMPSCREGANYLLNNYMFVDYRIGKQKISENGGLYQFYAWFSLNFHTHVDILLLPGNHLIMPKKRIG